MILTLYKWRLGKYLVEKTLRQPSAFTKYLSRVMPVKMQETAFKANVRQAISNGGEVIFNIGQANFKIKVNRFHE